MKSNNTEHNQIVGFCKKNHKKKCRNKFLLQTEYDTMSRKHANDILNNIVKTRRREKSVISKLTKEEQEQINTSNF